jgi:hypothetical protein
MRWTTCTFSTLRLHSWHSSRGARDNEVAWHCHERLEHVNAVALRKLAREELVGDLPNMGQVVQLCEVCQVGMQ